MRNKLSNSIAGAAFIATATFTHSASAEIKVIASIKPLHSLVQGVMGNTGSPTLLVEGNQSPHDFSLKPSKAQALQDADLIFWIGPSLENFLIKPIETIAKNAHSEPLMETKGLTLLATREAGHFHDHHGEEKHDEHAKHDEHDDHDDHDDHDKHDEHDHGEEKHDDHAKHDEHDHDKHDDHAGHGDHGAEDPHIWLDPLTAKALVSQIAKELTEENPAKAAIYTANVKTMHVKLDALHEELEDKLHAVEGKKFVSFHDSLQYFENRYHVHAADAISINPTATPSAAR